MVATCLFRLFSQSFPSFCIEHAEQVSQFWQNVCSALLRFSGQESPPFLDKLPPLHGALSRISLFVGFAAVIGPNHGFWRHYLLSTRREAASAAVASDGNRAGGGQLVVLTAAVGPARAALLVAATGAGRLT